MADVVDKVTRSRMMSGIRSKDTKPEIAIRKALFSRGFRYRLHDKVLPGKPDLVFPRFNAVIFVDGCYWHMHDCALFKMPSSRRDFWKAKLEANRRRDKLVREQLTELDWRHMTVWECALKGKQRLDFESLISSLESWILKDGVSTEIRGHDDSRSNRLD